MMTKPVKFKIEFNNEQEKIPIPIVSDAAMANVNIADGRMLPVVIIDTSDRPDIEDAIAAHKYYSPGDVDSYWFEIPSRNTTKVGLFLRLLKPIACSILLEFDLSKRALLVDTIITSRGLYIQSGRQGDRLKDTMHNERIIVEIPSNAFSKEWNQILRKAMARKFRDKGFSRKDADEMGKDFISEMRKFGSIRIK